MTPSSYHQEGFLERTRGFFLQMFVGKDYTILLQERNQLLRERDRLLGIIENAAEEHRKKITEFQKEHKRITDQFAKAAGLKDATIKILETRLAKAKTLSHTDPLTGLFNRRGAVDRLIGEASAVWRSMGSPEQLINKRLPCSVVYIDLDNFKPINDRFGHATGDQALVAVAELLRKKFPRGGDIIARVGGDEFIVIMINASHQIARRRSDDFLREMTAAVSFTFGDMHVDASIGIASTILSSPTSLGGTLGSERVTRLLNTTIEEADAAMLLSKRMGRSKVIVEE